MLEQAKSLLTQLVAFDTTSRNSNLEIIHFIQDYLREQGVASELLFNTTKTKANLLARIGAGTGGLMLSGHTDVVPVDNQDWHTDPFCLTEKDGSLYGRGTADMKGFIACVLAMVPQLAKLSLQRPILLAFSYDEEIGCLGAPSLAEHISQQQIMPDLAVIGEPTEMRVVAAHKGIHSFETVITGYEGHSSAPAKGVNAVTVGANLVQFLDALNREFCEHGKKDSLFDPHHTTVHVGVMKGGTARNIIPGECRLLWEIRPLPGEDVEAIVKRFHVHCTLLKSDMKDRFAGCNIETRALSSVTGLQQVEDFAHMATLLHVAEGNRTYTAAFTTEAGIFQQYGIPAIVCGPGSIEQAHKPDEFIAVSQLKSCLAFLTRLVGSPLMKAA